MTEDLISCSIQSLVGTNLCEARTKKSSVVGSEGKTLDLGRCLDVARWNSRVFHLVVNFKLKRSRHAPWETDSFLNCFAQGHAITKRPWNALVIVIVSVAKTGEN